MLGHLAIGAQLIAGAAEDVAAERRLPLLNCVLSHHGPDAASGRGFDSAEALALYRLNALDASVKGPWNLESKTKRARAAHRAHELAGRWAAAARRVYDALIS
jgi:23S rRNA maturation-related 3'-5' exoribonuclease YhaM